MHRYGFSLIEFLLAITIAILLWGVLCEIYLASLHSFEIQNALRYLLQNNLKIADIISHDVKRAGHIGCPQLTNNFKINSTLPINPQNKIIGTDNEIILRYMEFPNSVLLAETGDGKSLIADKSIIFSKADSLIVSDCSHAEILQVKKVIVQKQQQIIFPGSELKFFYGKNAEVGRFIIRKYFLANTNQFHRDGRPIFSLYRTDQYHIKVELVHDVAQLHFLYSVFYHQRLIDMPAKYINDWSMVKGIAITLKLNSSPFKKQAFFYVKI